MQEEIWRVLPGYIKPKIYVYQQDLPNVDLFQISNLGRVKSYRYNEPKIINQWTNPNGYKYFQFKHKGKRVSLLTHRAVMFAFYPKPEGNKQVNHIDFNRGNNTLENLEWATALENITHSKKAGRYPSQKGEASHLYGKTGKSHPRSQPVNQLDFNGNLVKTWDSANLAAIALGGNRSHISKSIRIGGKAYGHFWEKA